jgi:hypothetical protein
MLTELRSLQESGELVPSNPKIGTRGGRKQNQDQIMCYETETNETHHRISYLENLMAQILWICLRWCKE